MNEFYLICITLALQICIIPSLAVPELKLVHVLFAHKLHAPKKNNAKNDPEISIPQNLSYEYFTSAATDMSKNAKLNMYNFGVHLRKIYGDFLGDLYFSDIMKMRTTEYTLSMLSAQLVNAGLWPPSNSQTWMEGFNWQPIPSDYLELEDDTLLLGSLCPNFVSQMDEILRRNETRKMMAQYQPLFDHLSEYTKREINTPSDVAVLYAILETMADQSEILPNWAMDVFPDGAMYNVSLLEYDLLSETLLQRQLNGGILLEEIIGNSLKYSMGDISKKRKLMLYSGDERNIVGVLKSLDLWSPHIPNEAAALIFELYFDNDINLYGMKINYYTGIDDKTISLSLPNCTEICPLQTLIDIAFVTIPQNPQSLCGWSVRNPAETEDQLNRSEESNSTNHNLSKNLIFILILLNLKFGNF
ncbi:venom acid phosphatase Acph-1-like isoform X2 [Linepithema humile]|nr:PREDICTED: venom acid phosphatase Acph-1-like [Linepithema humile]XP_012231965.1 PREDICTED: venom acid phosphatase Acph-1-like [Linepithema humile]XP_012231966.1 PREDICTED: venom acid phosphatase Acph-1-like [Linepithema humile]